jgi:hypothetical protein
VATLISELMRPLPNTARASRSGRPYLLVPDGRRAATDE